MKKLLLVLLLVFSVSANAFAAVKLPDGYVKGLPKDLAVMDESGYSPDGNNGELFINIENMKPNTTYTKDISLTNLRTDAKYNIYMTATPNYSKGNVDMLNETKCKLYLDNNLIYEGLVNGDGSPNMQDVGLNLGGVFKSGQSKTLHAEFVWDWSGKTSYAMPDNGYYGELSFIWTFYAYVKTGGSPPDDNGGTPEIRHNTSEVTTSVITDTRTEDSTITKEVPSIEDGDYDVTDDTDDTDDTDSTDNIGDDDNISDTDGTGDTVIVEPTVSEDTKDVDSIGKPADIVKKIIDKIPFIPDNVKTGFESFLTQYTALALGSFSLAVILIVVIVVKSKKLKKLKDKE